MMAAGPPDRGGPGGRGRAGAMAGAVLVIAAAGALTGCASSPGPAAAGGGISAGTPALSLATSLSSVNDSWAVVPVTASPVFWEVLVRPSTAATWRLVTPPAVASNGGLIAADGGTSLTVAVRPSENLRFSPLAATPDAGITWSTPAPLSAGVASSPGALAAAGRRLLAALSDGTILASADAGASWHTIASPGAIASTPAGRTCGTVRVSSVSFGRGADVALAAGRCGATGATGIFSHSGLAAGGGWQRVGLPVTGQVLRLFPGGMTLVRARTGLTVLWDGTGGSYAPPAASAPPSAASWTASAPLPVTGPVTASGELTGSGPAAGDGAWALLPGGRAATISGPGQPWVPLPPAPVRTVALADGPDGAVDALAIAGTRITVWRLARAATIWTKIQSITVPIQYGSSS